MNTEKAALRIVKQALLASRNNDTDSAVVLIKKAWNLCRSSKKVLMATAGSLVDLGQDEAALELLQEASLVHGNTEEIFKIIGELAQRMQLFDMAEKAYSQVCSLNMSDASNLLNLALSQQQNNKPEEAIQLLQSSLQIFPENARMWETLGILLIDYLNDHQNGILFLRQAVSLAPKSVTALHNLAVKLYFGPEAEELFQAALKIEPENAQVHLSYALFLFSEGRTAEAWAHYEYRLHPDLGAAKVPHFTHGIPPWTGQSLKGKSILICAEQGIGDEVMFAAYTPELISQAEKVYIGCEPRLVSAFERSFPTATVEAFEDRQQFRSRHRSFPHLEAKIKKNDLDINYSVTAGSVPMYLESKMTDVKGDFLIPPKSLKNQIGAMLGDNDKPKVAISWRSGKLSKERRNSYFSTEVFRRVAARVDAEFYVLQYDMDEAECAALADIKNVHFLNEIDLKQDIEANLAILSCMDWSIGPSTAVQMFAAAVGCPVIMLARDKPWTFFGQQEMGNLYAESSRFIPYEDDDTAEVQLIEMLTVRQNAQDNRARRLAEHFNSKPPAWSATAAGQRLGKKRDTLYRQVTQSELLMPRSSAVENAAKSLDSVVLSIGAYHGMTDTASAIFALHPNSVVLNLAYQRIRLFTELDFVRDPSPEKAAGFLEVAATMVQNGLPGDFGGSILKSRLFWGRTLWRQAYSKKYDNRVLKDDTKVVFWNDAMRLTNATGALLNEKKRFDIRNQVRLLLPLGDPVMTAKTHARSGHCFYLTGNRQSTFEQTLVALLDMYEQLFSMRANKKISFFPLWEHELSKETLQKLCAFSGLDFSEDWANTVLAITSAQITDKGDELEQRTYRRLLDNKFLGMADIKNQFEAMLDFQS